jgi:hypothetical protein
MSVAANIILFQVGWFACVLGAARGSPWIGLLAVALIAAWHLSRARAPVRELILLGIAAGLGLIFDSALVRLGLVEFSSGVVVAGFAPAWMIALWMLFATTLNVSLRWLRQRPAVTAVLGCVGGALAYYSGARLGALTLTPARTTWAMIGIGWGLLTPTLFYAARRCDGFAPL